MDKLLEEETEMKKARKMTKVKWLAITSNKRSIRISAENRIDAEKKAWSKAKRGEEVLYIIPEIVHANHGYN